MKIPRCYLHATVHIPRCYLHPTLKISKFYLRPIMNMLSCNLQPTAKIHIPRYYLHPIQKMHRFYLCPIIKMKSCYVQPTVKIPRPNLHAAIKMPRSICTRSWTIQDVNNIRPWIYKDFIYNQPRKYQYVFCTRTWKTPTCYLHPIKKLLECYLQLHSIYRDVICTWR